MGSSNGPTLEIMKEQAKAVRTALDLSPGELANTLGVRFSTVNRLENSKTVPFKLARRQFESFCVRMKEQGKLKHD